MIRQSNYIRLTPARKYEWLTKLREPGIDEVLLVGRVVRPLQTGVPRDGGADCAAVVLPRAIEAHMACNNTHTYSCLHFILSKIELELFTKYIISLKHHGRGVLVCEGVRYSQLYLQIFCRCYSQTYVGWWQRVDGLEGVVVVVVGGATREGERDSDPHTVGRPRAAHGGQGAAVWQHKFLICNSAAAQMQVRFNIKHLIY